MLIYKCKLCFLSSSFVFLFGFSSFIFIIYVYWDPKLTNLKLSDQSQLWSVLPPVLNAYC